MAVRQVLLGRTRRGLLLRLAALCCVLALAAAYVVWPRATTFSRATGLLPTGTSRVLWTDWSALRHDGSCRRWPACEGRLGDEDLDAASVLTTSAEALQAHLDWGPRTIGWELLGQARAGQVLVIGGLSSDRLRAIRRAYATSGFTPPKHHPTDGGVWSSGSDQATAIGLDEPLFQHAAFLPDRGVLLSSDDPGYLADAVRTARDGDGLDFRLAGRVDAPLAAVGLVGDRACAELSFATADTDAQAAAGQLVEAAGGVNPLEGYLVALGPGRSWTAALGFESDDQARHDLATRRRLAVADDPGQMTSYGELFRLDRADRHGHEVVLSGHARRSAYALSQVTQGPVLLASC